MDIKRAFSFDDVLVIPQYSCIKSRKEIDLSVKAKNVMRHFETPIISAPMDSVTETAMAIAMDRLGGLGIIHRYNTIDAQTKMVHDSFYSGSNNIGAAIGMTEDYRKRAIELVRAGANILCIDVAHGHHFMMKNCLEVLRKVLGEDVHLMAGNVATLQAFNDLSDWGADSIRVGIGGGSICSTRIQTGHGIPTLQSIIDCSRSDRDTLLVADGGIKNSGDMVKALAAGADMVMCGSLLSGTDETPGRVTQSLDGRTIKEYRGMASREAQKSWRNKIGSVEGIATTVDIKGPVDRVVKDLSWGIKSGLSYSGCSNLREFAAKSQMIQQTAAGAKESNTHILSVV